MALRQESGNPVYSEIVHGEIAGSATAVQLPDVPGRLFEVQAASSNAGNVYLGASAAVTLPTGVANATAGLEFTPGQSRLLFVANLNVFWLISGAGDDLLYLAYR